MSRDVSTLSFLPFEVTNVPKNCLGLSLGSLEIFFQCSLIVLLLSGVVLFCHLFINSHDLLFLPTSFSYVLLPSIPHSYRGHCSFLLSSFLTGKCLSMIFVNSVFQCVYCSLTGADGFSNPPMSLRSFWNFFRTRCLLLLQLTIFVVCCFTALLKNPYINSWSLNPISATPVDSNRPGLLVSITSRRIEDVRVTRVTMSIKHLSSSTSSTSINSFPSLSLGFSLSKFRFHVMMTVWRLEMAHEIILSSSSSNSWC